MSITNSKEVEERVLKMTFDNESFERKTKQSLATLEKLKSSLDFRGASKGLENITSSTNILSKNINVLSNGVQSIKHEFSSLEVVGATCLVNLTNSAIKAGKNIVNALALEPVKTGFQEYETKMGAIQTILTNTAKQGTSLNEVIDALDELNLYADKTIYNFQQMTKNVGTFTAAGLDLQTSTASIQGIANLAAASGSTSQQASTAMYQLSQALSAGYVKLMDWNSVVNAGMGGTLFQDALKETAKEMGTDVDAIIKAEGSFRNSLQQGWITADVLATTLRKFTVKGAKEYGDAMIKNGKYTTEANKALMEQAQRMEDAATKVKTFTQLWSTLKETAQSGWGKTWEIIVGDYDKAKEFFTQVNDVISPLLDRMADARNNLLEKALGSPSKWNEIVDSFSKAGIGIESINKAFAKTYVSKGIIKDTKEFSSLLEKYGGDYTAMVKGIKEEGLDSFEFINLTRESLKEAVRENANYTESQMSATEKLKKFQKVVNDVWRGDYGNQNPDQRAKALEKEGYEYERVQRLVNLVKDAKSGYALTMEDLTEEDLRSLGLTKAEIEAYRELEAQLKDTDSELNAWIASMQKAEGRELLIDSLFNIGRAIKSVVKPIAEAFQSVFAPLTGDDIYAGIEAFNKFTKSLILTEEQAEVLKDVFKVVFNVFDSVRTVMGTGLRLAIGIVTRLFSAMNISVGPLVKGLAEGTATLREFIKQNDIVPLIINKIGPVIDTIGKKLSNLGDTISKSELFNGNFVSTLTTTLSSIGTVIKNKIGSILSIFGFDTDKLTDEMKPEEVAETINENISTIVKNVDIDVPQLISESLSGSKEKDAGKKSLLRVLGEKLYNGLVSIASGLKNALFSAMNWIKENIDPSVVISSSLIFVMTKTAMKLGDMLMAFTKPLTALSDMFSSFAGVGRSLQKYINEKRTTLAVDNFVKVAASILILAVALDKIAKINVVGLVVALTTIGILIVEIQVLTHILVKGTGTQDRQMYLAIQGSLPLLIGIAALVYIMVKSFLKLTEVAWEDIPKAELALFGIMSIIVLFMAVMKKLYTLPDQGIELKEMGAIMIGLGIAMQRLIKSVKIAGEMDMGTIKRGMIVVAAMLGFVTLMIRVISKGNSLKGSGGVGIAFIGIALAVKIMIGCVEDACEITTEQLKHAALVIGSFMGLITLMIFFTSFGGGKNASAAILAWSAAFMILPLIIKEINVLKLGEVEYALDIIKSIQFAFSLLLFASKFAGKYAVRAGALLVAATMMMAVMVPIIGILTYMAKTDQRAMWQAVGSIAIILGLMALIVGLSGINLNEGTGAKGLIIAVGITVALLSGVAVLLGVIPTEVLITGMIAIISVLLIMAVVIKAASHLEKDKLSIGGLIGIGITMVALVGIISVMLGIITLITSLFPNLFKVDNLIKIAASLAIMIVGMGLAMGFIMKNINATTQIPKGSFLFILGTLSTMALLVIGVVAAQRLIGNIDSKWSPEEMLINMATAVIIVMVLSFLAAKLSGFVNKQGSINLKDTNKLLLVIVELGVLLLGVSLAIKALQSEFLSFTTPDVGFIKSLGVMIALLLALTGVAAIVALISNKTTSGFGTQQGLVLMIAELAVIFVEIGLAFKAIEALDVKAIDISVLGELIAVMLGLSIVAGVLMLVSNQSKSEFGAQQGYVLMLAEVAAIAWLVSKTVMPALNLVDSNNIIPAAAALGIVMLTLSVIAGLAAGASAALTPSLSMLGSIILEGGMLFIVAAIASFVATHVMQDLNKIDSDNIVKAALGLGIVMVALGVTMSIISGVVAAVGMLNGIGAAVVMGVMAFIGGVLAAIGEWYLEAKGEDIMANVEAMTKYMGPIGKNLKAFFDAISTFTADKDALKKVQTAFDAIDKVTKLAVLKDLTEWGEQTDTSSFGTAFENMAKGINAIFDIFKNEEIDPEKVQQFADTIAPIIKLQKTLYGTDGAKQFLLGEKDLAVFGNQLGAFSEGCAKLIYNLDRGVMIDGARYKPNWVNMESVVNQFSKCIEPIINLQKKLYGYGGVWQDFFGDKDFLIFITNVNTALPTFGRFMKKLKEDEAYYDADHLAVVTNFSACFVEICKAANAIPNEGGYLATWIGDQNLSNFATGIKRLADAMGTVDKYVHGEGTNWNKADYEKFAECITVIGETKIPKTEDGWWQKLTSNLAPDTEKFAAGIKSLAEAMGVVDSTLKNASVFKDGSIINIFKNLDSAIDNLPDLDAATRLDQWVTEVGGQTFSDNLKTVGNGIAAFVSPFSSINTTNLSSSATSLSLLTEALKNASSIDFGNLEMYGGNIAAIGNSAVSGFVTAFEGSYADCAKAMTQFATNVEEAFKYNAKYRLIIVGKNAAQFMIDGLSDSGKVSELNRAITSLWTNGLSLMTTYAKSAFEAGANVAQGFINGIYSKKTPTEQSVDDLTNFIGPRMSNNLQERSPSKLTFKIGAYVGEGLANGMLSSLYSIQSAADALTNESTIALNDAITNMYDSFSQETFNPTITPVVDMTEVQNGFGYINGLLNNSTIGLNGRNLSVTPDLTNTDVIDTLNMLTDSLGSSTVNNYNVNGITYDDGSNVASAVGQLIYAANIARRS